MATSKRKPVAIPADKQWEIERDLATLMEAKKIEADPKRMKAAQSLAKQKMLDAGGIAADCDD